jgi:hypothetical protein
MSVYAILNDCPFDKRNKLWWWQKNKKSKKIIKNICLVLKKHIYLPLNLYLANGLRLYSILDYFRI